MTDAEIEKIADEIASDVDAAVTDIPKGHDSREFTSFAEKRRFDAQMEEKQRRQLDSD